MFHRLHRRRTPVRVGLRTIKTALAVVLSLLVVSLFGKPTIFAALAAIAVMSPTFEAAVQECRAQGVGILIGGVLGCLTVKLFPSPPIWLLGGGVMLILTLCAARRLEYAAALSCAIFLSPCLSGSDTVLLDTLIRLMHTATGLGIGLAVNVLILPYDNRPRILELLRQLCEELPGELQECVVMRHYPDLSAHESMLARLHYELRIYTHQPFLGRKVRESEIAFLSGCIQLAERMLQELFAISCLDTIGAPSAENLQRLQQLGIASLPDDTRFSGVQEKDAIVTNYHLEKLLEAREYLVVLLAEAAKS